MRNNYSDIASGYSSNSVTALMKIKASSITISNRFYQKTVFFMNCLLNKQFMKSILLANFCNKQFMKLILLANFCNKQFMKSILLANFCNKQFMKLILLANFCNKQFMKSQLLYNNFNLLTNKMSLQFCILIEQIIVIASNGVYRIKMPFKTTLPSLHIANLKGSNRYADWFP